LKASLTPSTRKSLKLIGYWAPAHHWTGIQTIPGKPSWPDIRRAVQPGWRLTDRESLVDYLGSGTYVIGYLGSSSCRFGCCDYYDRLGSQEYTDGEWVWPGGLSHYVERHAVILPDEFVASASARGWKAPPVEQGRNWGPNEYEYSFWLEWAKGLPDFPVEQSTPDSAVMDRFCLVLRYRDTSWPNEQVEAFTEDVWQKGAEKFGVELPGLNGDQFIEGISVTNRNTVLAIVLSGLRQYQLTDRLRLFYREPDPGDWQRSRDVPVSPWKAAELGL